MSKQEKPAEAVWKKVKAVRAGDVVSPDDLSAGARGLLDQESRVETLISELTAAGKWPDAIAVMARALPRREAVWWACVCIRKHPGHAENEADLKALHSAERWVIKPTDEGRVQAFQMAQAGSDASAGMLAALATASLERKLVLSDDMELEMDVSTFPSLVSTSVLMAAGHAEGDALTEQYDLFMRMGQHIAEGGNGNIDAKPAADS